MGKTMRMSNNTVSKRKTYKEGGIKGIQEEFTFVRPRLTTSHRFDDGVVSGAVNRAKYV